MKRLPRCYKTGKEAFATKLDADLDRARILKNAVKHRKASNRELPKRAYHCEFCRHWHHTSQTKDEENETRDDRR